MRLCLILRQVLSASASFCARVSGRAAGFGVGLAAVLEGSTPWPPLLPVAVVVALGVAATCGGGVPAGRQVAVDSQPWPDELLEVRQGEAWVQTRAS